MPDPLLVSVPKVPPVAPIAPEMTVFDAPVTLSGVAVPVALIGPLRVRVPTGGGGVTPTAGIIPGAASLLIVNGWLVPTEMVVAIVWFAVVNPETVSRFADAPLSNVIVWEGDPMV